MDLSFLFLYPTLLTVHGSAGATFSIGRSTSPVALPFSVEAGPPHVLLSVHPEWCRVAGHVDVLSATLRDHLQLPYMFWISKVVHFPGEASCRGLDDHSLFNVVVEDGVTWRGTMQGINKIKYTATICSFIRRKNPQLRLTHKSQVTVFKV